MLPVGVFPKKKVQLSGGEVEVRGLSFEEGRLVRGDDAVYVMVALACDLPTVAVREWAQTVPAGDVKRLTDAIEELSGFNEGADFPK